MVQNLLHEKMNKIITLKKTKSVFYSLLFIVLSWLVIGCQNQTYNQYELERWMEDNGKIKVLSTTEMIGAIVKEIGKDKIDHLSLIQSEQDPHSYELVKGDSEKLERANIIFYNGLGLEHGPGLQSTLFHYAKAIALGDVVVEKYPDEIIYENKVRDPHIWMDVALWAKIIEPITETLIKYDPQNKIFYQENADKIYQELMGINQVIKDKMHEIPEQKRYLVTSHDAFNYFARSYLATEEERKNDTWRKRFQAPEGLAPEGQISVVDVRRIVDFLKNHQIHVLFLESNVNPDSIEKIFSTGNRMGLKLFIASEPLYGDSIGDCNYDKSNCYVNMLLHNANVIQVNLNKNYE